MRLLWLFDIYQLLEAESIRKVFKYPLNFPKVSGSEQILKLSKQLKKATEVAIYSAQNTEN